MPGDNTLTVVDLFAGPGGLSEGFWQAGFDVICSVEMDKWATETLKTRHIYHMLVKAGKVEEYNKYLYGEIDRCELLKYCHRDSLAMNEAIIQEKMSPDTRIDILSRIENQLKRLGYNNLDVLIGGPPCELYSTIGRARYSVMKDKYWQDERLGLYEEYAFFLEELQPQLFVFENVTGLLSAKLKDGSLVINRLIDRLRDAGYEIFEPYGKNYVLNAAEFGVPQMRKRVIIIGYRKDLHFGEGFYHKLYKEKSSKLLYTVRDAILDLPSLKCGEGSDRWYKPYDKEAHSEYAKQMRKDSPGVLNHKARAHSEADRARYLYFIEQSLMGKRANILDLLNDAPELRPNHKNTKTFLDRFKVQVWDYPSNTITSHLSRDGNYYIHPDPAQCRSFTVREAARCQSFPDNYLFEGPRTAQFKQVGSAVPPILSYSIADTLKKMIRERK